MPRKKNPTPMSWSEVRDVVFTDKKWASINRDLKLPEIARHLIEKSISYYPFHHGNHAGYPTPTAARAELRKIERLAQRLLYALKNMNERTYYALVDTAENLDWRRAREIWLERTKNVDEIMQAIPAAVKIVERQKKVKSGPNSFALDHLVEQVDDILHLYKGIKINRGKARMNFIRAVATLADPDIQDGSIDAAIKRVAGRKPNDVKR